VGDLVEWCRDVDGPGPGRTLRRGRGELLRIRNIATGAHVEEMESLELGDFVFTIKDTWKAALFSYHGEPGGLRLSPRPWKDF
jgi:hypothetical protein